MIEREREPFLGAVSVSQRLITSIAKNSISDRSVPGHKTEAVLFGIRFHQSDTIRFFNVM